MKHFSPYIDILYHVISTNYSTVHKKGPQSVVIVDKLLKSIDCPCFICYHRCVLTRGKGSGENALSTPCGWICGQLIHDCARFFRLHCGLWAKFVVIPSSIQN